jgi:hypothetical protein
MKRSRAWKLLKPQKHENHDVKQEETGIKF